MKKIILTATATLLLSAQISTAEYASDQVKAECSAKWGTQYDMVKYCMDKRQAGWVKFSAFKDEFGNTPLIKPSLDHCADKWGQQWDMVQYCTEKQFEGLETLSNTLETLPVEIGNEIQSTCAAKWYPQFDMVAYCAEKQSNAWRALQD